MSRAFSVMLLVPAAALAFFIHQSLVSASPASPGDPLSRLIGSAEEAVGDTLFLKADSYFHGGVTEHYDDNSPADISKQGHIDDDEEAASKVAPADWIARINAEVGAHEHRH